MKVKRWAQITLLAGMTGGLAGCGGMGHHVISAGNHHDGDDMMSAGHPATPYSMGDGADHHGDSDMMHEEYHHADDVKMHHDDDESEGHGHQHDRWIDPPENYQTQTVPDWNDTEAARRGKVIYGQYCQSCHGAEGEGDGPGAAGLSHRPADLHHHFHGMFQHSDHYLFWRVSEGGQAEPFKSEASAMPAFKNVLSEQARWDVLTYIHQRFHETAEHSE